MIDYTIFNLCISVLASATMCITHGQPPTVWKNVRIAVLVTILSYPWDFFAIMNKAWVYPKDPGIRLFSVPLNDLWFIFVCTLITTSLLSYYRPTGVAGANR
jgi:lycopene cyclase domain-containing protein